MRYKITLTLLTLLMANAFSAFAVEIGVYVSVDENLVTETETKDEWRATVDAMIFEANELYDESNVDIELVSSRVDFRDMSFTTSSGLIGKIAGEESEFKGILTEADKHGGDYIIALTDLDALRLCGQAIEVNKSQADISTIHKAIAISDPDCGEDTFVHELGHLMGLAHGDQVAEARGNTDHGNGLASYAKGWGNIVEHESVEEWSIQNGEWVMTNGHGDEKLEDGEYGTLMVGNHVVYWTGAWNVKVPLFSSPDTSHDLCGDSACGNAVNGDASRALNENSLIYASHEERDADHLVYSDVKLSQCLISSYAGSEVIDLNVLNCSSKDIGDITGIDQLSYLTSIDLSDNRIVNLTSLEKFSDSSIQSINLDGNDTALCHQLDVLDRKYPGKMIMPERCFNIGTLIAVLSVL